MLYHGTLCLSVFEFRGYRACYEPRDVTPRPCPIMPFEALRNGYEIAQGSTVGNSLVLLAAPPVAWTYGFLYVPTKCLFGSDAWARHRSLAVPRDVQVLQMSINSLAGLEGTLEQWHAAALTALKRLEALVRAAQPAQPAQRAAQVWISLRIRFSPRFDFMEWDLETVGNTCMDASK